MQFQTSLAPRSANGRDAPEGCAVPFANPAVKCLATRVKTDTRQRRLDHVRIAVDDGNRFTSTASTNSASTLAWPRAPHRINGRDASVMKSMVRVASIPRRNHPRRSQRPVDGECRIIPTHTAGTGRCIRSTDQVVDPGVGLQRLEAMRATGGNIQRQFVFIAQLHGTPAPERRRIGTHVEHNVVNGATLASYEFRFLVGSRLPVHSAQGARGLIARLREACPNEVSKPWSRNQASSKCVVNEPRMSR